MKVCYTLICILFLTALQDGDTGGTNRGMEGTNITVGCSFSSSGSRRFFCKENCEGENILIETTKERDQRGRYSIQYKENGYFSYVLYVSITGLTKSDTGKYRCRLDKTWMVTLYEDFNLIVTEASTTSEPKWIVLTLPPSSSSSSSSSSGTSTLTQSFSSSSSSFSTETIKSTRTSFGHKDLLLYVGLVLSILIIILAAALLIFLKKRSFGPQKVKTEFADTAMVDIVYEEIRDQDRENKPPPEELASVYVYAKPCNPNSAESNDIYSLASSPQSKVEVDEVDYSEVHLLDDTGSSNSAPCGRADDVTYSKLQIAASSTINNE